MINYRVYYLKKWKYKDWLPYSSDFNKFENILNT